MMRAREKLRVERVARNMPRRSREIHCANRILEVENSAEREIKEARRTGTRRLERVKARRVLWKVCD